MQKTHINLKSPISSQSPFHQTILLRSFTLTNFSLVQRYLSSYYQSIFLQLVININVILFCATWYPIPPAIFHSHLNSIIAVSLSKGFFKHVNQATKEGSWHFLQVWLTLHYHIIRMVGLLKASFCSVHILGNINRVVLKLHQSQKPLKSISVSVVTQHLSSRFNT